MAKRTPIKERKLKKYAEQFDYKLDGYYGDKAFARFICPKGTLTLITPLRFEKGERCPCCSNKKLTGYRKEIPGFFYLVRWTHPETNHTFLKFGITNKHDPFDRILNQMEHTEYNPSFIIRQKFSDGSIPFKIESKVKQTLRCKYINKSMFQDGYTETIEDNNENELFVFDEVAMYKKAA